MVGQVFFSGICIGITIGALLTGILLWWTSK